MVTKKQLQEQINSLSKEVEELRQTIITDELKHLRKIKELFDEQKEDLANVRFSVKSAKYVENDDGSKEITVVYQLPVIHIPLDEKNEPSEKNPFFYSVNSLGLVGMEDYDKIRYAFELAKKQKN